MEPLVEQLVERTLNRARRQLRPPESTYRIQFHAGFTFRDAIQILPYLRDLGITHLYASPYLKARAGSTHGYDVIDSGSINPEIGTAEDFTNFLEALRANGLYQILDIVPNHMGVGTNENRWWNDVLQNGTASHYAEYFDIAWENPPRLEMAGKVLIPALGAPIGEVIEKGELKVVREQDDWFVSYFDRRFPLSKQSGSELSTRFSGVSEPRLSQQKMKQLLDAQAYRLSFWRTAPDEINYRRFFEINDLAAIRMERPEVFEDVHRLVMTWLGEGNLAGIRIDHPDGLYDPAQYLHRLQARYLWACAAAEMNSEPSLAALSDEEVQAALANSLTSLDRDFQDGVGKPLYVVVEKILADGEGLRQDWPVDGTTGYDFLIKTNGLFVNSSAEDSMTDAYALWAENRLAFADIVHAKKLVVLDNGLRGDLEMLSRRLDQLAQSDWQTRDFTLRQLRDAVREVVACFPVYRSFVVADRVSPEDKLAIDSAIAEAHRRNPKLMSGVLEFLRSKLMLAGLGNISDEIRRVQMEFVGRFQQLTAPVTAKGVEDTAFYVYSRLSSLNEVGGDPGRFGTSSDEVHRYFADRQKHWPYALSALSTHDTKRSEDVRARLNVLSEIPAQWEASARRWRDMNEPHRGRVGSLGAPTLNEEYFLYQALVGAWPLEFERGLDEEFKKRIQAYLLKSLREAKVNTNWNDPNAAYEEGVEGFIAALLDAEKSRAFLEDLRLFLGRVSWHGLLNSLSQTLVKLTAPGVPDTYQGTEVWDFSLVDPDNRRPVDYASRRQALHELQSRSKSEGDATLVRELASDLGDGRAKLFVTYKALHCRRGAPGLFTVGGYEPAELTGADVERVFAFWREHEGVWGLTVVPRFTAGRDEQLGEGVRLLLPKAVERSSLRNVFTGEVVELEEGSDERWLDVAKMLADFPVALLISEP